MTDASDTSVPPRPTFLVSPEEAGDVLTRLWNGLALLWMASNQLQFSPEEQQFEVMWQRTLHRVRLEVGDDLLIPLEESMRDAIRRQQFDVNVTTAEVAAQVGTAAQFGVKTDDGEIPPGAVDLAKVQAMGADLGPLADAALPDDPTSPAALQDDLGS